MDGSSLQTAFLFAAGDWIEIIGALLFFLITGLVQWVQKRSKAGGSTEETQPPATEMPAETALDTRRTQDARRRDSTEADEFDIEAELRRLLNPGKPPEPPPQAAPPRLPSAVPPRIGEDSEAFPWESLDNTPSRPLPSTNKAGPGVLQRNAPSAPSATRSRGFDGHPDFEATSHEHTAKFRDRVTHYLHPHPALGMAAAPAPSTALMLSSKTSPAALALAKSLRSPRSIRQAVLLSTILQPPKGLDPGSS